MIFKSFQIKNYKSFVDSGLCSVQNGVTILAGQNESGKTNVLKELEEIEQDIIRGLPTKNYSLSLGVPCSVSFAMNFPSYSNKAHLLFPMSLYLDAVSDNAVLSALKKGGR